MEMCMKVVVVPPPPVCKSGTSMHSHSDFLFQKEVSQHTMNSLTFPLFMFVFFGV